MPSPVKSFGEFIKEARLTQKLSMRDLAAKASLRSPAFIADLEKGFRFPSPEVLDDLAAALGIPAKNLRDHDPRAPLQELKELTEKTPSWAPALRKLVESANAGTFSPAALTKALKAPQKPEEPQENLLF